eukprot:CAMPEP_0113958542 /NCGR_PEP_ID=MMETSP0011_2-20120614/3510_1 /TAXON_ID=101924 /ORGANISM="Rhodosorus marinus" /LENGTH=80 /DNA_ID=CAMNT_0000969481 /DNA_START=84 /DNA_END=326 /DNA_ORIENTATION=- /assembly_acc=CAM_ASM_000156
MSASKYEAYEEEEVVEVVEEDGEDDEDGRDQDKPATKKQKKILDADERELGNVWGSWAWEESHSTSVPRPRRSGHKGILR